MSQSAPYILLDDQITHEVRYYTNPIDIVEARNTEEVEAALEKLKGYHAQGYYLAGYLSYDLGFALEPKLAELMPQHQDGPFLQFGVFKSVSSHAPVECLYTSQKIEIALKPHWSEADYTTRFNRVMEYIRAGDVYQINLTFPMTGDYAGSADKLYAAFRSRQKGRYGGIVSLGSGPEIISLSPELFFRKEELGMSMRPMKGTRPRADTVEADNTLREDMRFEPKSQAENLMIVDLLRNDLSRVSEPGSVQVPELFSLETYPTLHQMTSRVTSRLKPDTEFSDIFKSLFPCGSVTGAPKIRAMEIIDELEDSSRGAYCGGLGYIDPDGEACFNVAIRTIILEAGKLRYNVGSGLVLDSEASDEYGECLLKADVLKAQKTELIETLKWDSKTKRLVRRAAHMSRAFDATAKLNIPLHAEYFDIQLNSITESSNNQRVRATISEHGIINITTSDYVPIDEMKVSISKYPLTSDVQTTAHKVSNRQFYDGERERLKALAGSNEVIFINEKDELCEGSFTSLFIEKDGQVFTPPLSAGLLPGILRAELIQTDQAIEKLLKIDDLLSADKIYLGNSLRGLIPAVLINPKPC